MKADDLIHAVSEAERFLRAASDLMATAAVWQAPGGPRYRQDGVKIARIKRASMDLTRALPALRRSQP